MKAEHLNAFIQGTQNTFSMFFGEDTKLGKLFLKGYPYTAEKVCVEVGIVGGIQGSVIYNLSESGAFFVASKLMMGMPVTTLDEMAKSAVSEMANMISGQVASILFGIGVTVDITAPILYENATPQDFKSIKEGSKVVCVPLMFANGDFFEIDLSFND